MKKLILLILFLIPIALPLAGCGTPLGNAVGRLTATIENPVGPVDIYRVKNTYAAALEVFVEYRRYCWSQPYAVLLTDPVARPVCERRREVVRALQKADQKAFFALSKAENFITQNPTLNAASVINEAWDAVTAFRKSVPAAS